MTREEAKERLVALNQAIATAVLVLKAEREILDRYFVEARNIDTFGPILDPTLWNSPERRHADALLRPVYEAARNLIEAYDRQREEIGAAVARADREEIEKLRAVAEAARVKADEHASSCDWYANYQPGDDENGCDCGTYQLRKALAALPAAQGRKP